MPKSFLRIAIVVVSLAAAGAMAGISGCAATSTSFPAAEEHSATGVLNGGADAESLRRGRAIFVTECAACHRLFSPGDYSPDQWRGIVTRMARRASLSGGQAADLELYLSAASRASKRAE